MLSLANNTPERPGDETKNSKDQDLAGSTDDLYPGIRDRKTLFLLGSRQFSLFWQHLPTHGLGMSTQLVYAAAKVPV